MRAPAGRARVRHAFAVAPALHDADAQTLDELMVNFRDLSLAREGGKAPQLGALRPDRPTVTSLGERGSEAVLPIIFPPQVAMIGFGRLVERPWISEGQVDVLNFVISVDQELGVDIPERDYPRVLTLDGFVAYLSERLEPAR